MTEPLCPVCGVRPQFRMGNGRLRGKCHECWASRTLKDKPPDGTRRQNHRGQWQVVVGGRWVDENRWLAAQLGVDLDPDTRVRIRGGRLEVASWQAVTVKGDTAGGSVSGRSRPARTRKRQGVYTEMDGWDLAAVDRLASRWGVTRAEAVRRAVRAVSPPTP